MNDIRGLLALFLLVAFMSGALGQGGDRNDGGALGNAHGAKGDITVGGLPGDQDQVVVADRIGGLRNGAIGDDDGEHGARGATDSHGQVNGGGTGSADGGITQGGPR